MDQVGMPSRRSTRFPEMCILSILRNIVIWPDNSDAGNARDLWTHWMRLNFSKISSQFELLSWINVLITEKDNRSFRHKESQFVLLLIAQLCQLNSDKFNAEMFSQMNDLRRCSKQSLFLWFRPGARVNVDPSIRVVQTR
jgi:hypothetical protein